ncbi:MAG: hypothetical protein ACJ8FO_06415 [Sphingomicrobium sp.]
MTGSAPEDSGVDASALRTEALSLIQSTRVDDLLKERFGDCSIVGSVALDLMSWRDIDLYVPVERSDAQRFIDVLPAIYGAFAGAAHTVVRATFNDEWAVPRGSYGTGYYCGFRVRTPAAVAWKIDLWGWGRGTYEAKLQEHRSLAGRLARADRDLILKLKQETQQLPEFRKEITSWDIYQFVLAGEGTRLAELQAFARNGGRRP